MHPDRLTKTIGLVLIGSSAILSGCSNPEPAADTEPYIDPTPHFWYFHGGGIYAPIPAGHIVTGSSFISGGRGISGFKSAGTISSVRGGFGSMGHAATAGA